MSEPSGLRAERDAALARVSELEGELAKATEANVTISRIVRRSLACGQLEKLDDARPYLTNAEPWPSRIGSALPAAPTPMHNPALDAAWDARHPPASEPEAQRAVLVGQVWRSKLYGFKRTVTRLSGERVHVEDVADGCTDVWPASNFVERHEWVSNPPFEPTGEKL